MMLKEDMHLETAVRTVTGFSSWADLEASLKGGYVPTFIPCPTDPQRVKESKMTVVSHLKSQGHKVWEGLGK